MNKPATRIALGVFIAAATLAASNAAHAQAWVRWQNASTPNGNVYFLGVSGGPICTPTRGCGYNAGTQMITWAWGQTDQDWQPTYPGTVSVQNRYGDRGVGDPWYLAVSGGSVNNNANVVIEPPGYGAETWVIQPAADQGAPYTGCYIFWNKATGKAMSVAGGVPNNGAHVVQYDLCTPTNGKCGNPSHAWHPDQFWCPVAD
ncbi:MAG TPA: hypothetical protein VHO67_19385 [Polyangia bacterium]|nr:hypothetical protein [Polyangia bacterium]